MHPHPVTQPNPTWKFPLTDMPTGLMAALVTRLADLLLRMGADALWRISRDEAQPLYTVFSFEARAVSRVYKLRFADQA